MDQIKAMRVFVHVVEKGSQVAAARSMDLSPPVVTRLIAELEASIGTRLLQRTTRRTTLTDIGEAFFERARQVLTEYDDALAMARSTSAKVEGNLRVLAPPAFAVHQLAKEIPRFCESHPNVTIELAIANYVHAPDPQHDVSIIVTGTADLSGEFIARPLARSEIVICATPAYLRRHGRPATPADIERHDLILPPVSDERRELAFYPRSPAGPQPAEPVLVRPRRPKLASMHLESNRAAILSELGLGGLPSFLVSQELRDGALVRVLPNWFLLVQSLYVGMPTRRFLPARTRAFVDFLLERFGGDGSRDPWLPAAPDDQQLPVQAARERHGFGLSRTPS